MRRLRVAHITTVDSTLRFMLLPQLRRLIGEGFEVCGISATGPWVSEIENAGVRHIAWHGATRAWKPTADTRAFLELVRILRRERFDIVHTHNPKPGVMGRVAARLARAPIVVNTVHGLYTTPEAPIWRRMPVLALERLAARFSDLELYQSTEDLEWARRIRLAPDSRRAYLGNGIDLTVFDPAAVPSRGVREIRRALDIDDDALVVGTVGRLVAEKGYREFLAVARAMRDTHPRVVFLAIGPADPAKADRIDRELAFAAGPNIRLLGWRADVRDLLATMDIFVLASWREGLPRSAIEAAAMGLPLVLTDVRGCREVIRDGVEGVLVPPRRPDRLAGAIGLLLEDANRRHAMGTAARTRAVERFDEDRVLETVVSTYHMLLDRLSMHSGNGSPNPAATAELRDEI